MLYLIFYLTLFQELINALQWVIVAYENSFLSVATQEIKANLPNNQQGKLNLPLLLLLTNYHFYR